ncbi:MAG TPA: serine hydrolase domain-containing protein [Verrucomicrobiae bacterium]|nr:serine hydrolase domain-containing protein [Verrucomicrobiae bacterium]
MKTLIACFLFVSSAAFAIPDALDRYIESQLKQRNVPGLSLAVARDGQIERAKGYGLADVELNVPATVRTVYQWASVSKQFTAEAIMLLARDGKLRLDDPIAKHYPDAPEAWSKVTIRHLLNHTSGIKSYTSVPNFFGTIRKDYKPDELIGLVRDLPLEFEPGDKWNYNNTGYYLLGLVIEKVSGKSYGEFLAERIFKPIGMTTARVNHQFEIIPDRATGYDNRSNSLWRSEFVSPTQPFSAGALVGTVLDLVKWDAALYTDKLLPTSDRQEMWTPTKLNDGKTTPYGYGWQTGDIRGHRYVAHGGGIHGFSTYILRLLDDKLTVIVLMNAGSSPETIARAVAGQYVNGITLATLDPKPDLKPELTKRLEKCLAELAETKESEMLTDEFRRDFSRSRRRHGNIVDDIKDKKSFTFVTSENTQSGNTNITRLASYRLATAKGARFYTFGLTPDDKIASLETEE